MSYRFQLQQDIYRWLVSETAIPNQGQISENLVTVPFETNQILQNGTVVAQIMKNIMRKSVRAPPTHLESVKNQNTKAVKSANWNFIWLSFKELNVQFDQRIRDLILGGESALIPEILKQLFQRDENKDQRGMKSVVIKEKEGMGKASMTAKTISLDVKKINPQKDPAESQSSLQFLILLLGKSLGLPVEQILGLFTNQNKYLAHLFVKGMNDQFQGIRLFYGLLLKNIGKMKQFCHGDHRDADSLLYAVKPGLISKDQRVAELTLEVFKSLYNIYNWFVSQAGRGATTLMLGVKRHPNLAVVYWEVLLKSIQNNQTDFFSNHFKKCFRDPQEMIEICTPLLAPLSQGLMRSELAQLGILHNWVQICGVLINQGKLQQKLIGFKFMGQILDHIPELIEENQDFLQPLRRNWAQKSVLEFTFLFQQILETLQFLAGDRNTMARRVFQIIIQIMQAVFQNDQKRQILVRGFISVLPKFPRIPSHFLIQSYQSGTLKTSDLQFVQAALSMTQDIHCVLRIAQILLKLFINHAVLNDFAGPILFKICKKFVSNENLQLLIMKIVKDCLTQFAQLQASLKNAQIAKHQPMYFVQKGNQKYSKEQQEQYLIGAKSAHKLITLVEKIIDLVKANKLQALDRAIRQDLMQANAILKKNHYKANIKVLSNILSKKFAVTRQQQQEFNEDFRIKRSLADMQESSAKRNMTTSGVIPSSSSRYGGPAHLRKDFDQTVQKRRQQQQERRNQEQRRQIEQIAKRKMVKKQLEKTNLLRGFMQEAQLKEDGFWDRFAKEKQDLQLYPPECMQGRDLQYIEYIFQKYHRILRTLFFKYTSSKYTTQSHNNTKFQDNTKRNQTLNVVELIQFLKDFKLFFLTSKEEIQNLVRDINVKLLTKRQTQNLDFAGFQQFVIQFCSIIYTKVHTINANTNKGIQVIKKNFNHLSHMQLVEEWFNYLKLIFIEKGQKTTLFDDPETAYFGQTEVIRQFTKKLEQDPGFILPEGYKKVTQKIMNVVPQVSDKCSGISQSYIDVFQVLDEILHESQLRLHLIEPMTKKDSKIRVKPQAFMNIKTKLLQNSQTKVRALSSILQKKTVIPPVKMLQRKILSLGMRLGLSYVNYKDKMLGQQVAYVIDDMLSAVEAGRQSIQKQRIVNDYLKTRQQQIEKQRFSQLQKEKKRLQRKGELQKMRKQYQQKLQTKKQEEKSQKQKQKSKEKKLKEDREKYLSDQKSKVDEKKKKQQQQAKQKKDQQKKNRKETKKKNEDSFNNFNQKQIDKFKKELETQAEKKKKEQEKQEQEQKKKQELVKKLRNKIHASDKKAIEIKQKTNEQISELYESEDIQYVYKEFQSALTSLFDFLLKETFHALTAKKVNSELTYDTWHYFALVFQLNPFIIKGKQLNKIFKFFTKDKQLHREYQTGLNYQQFKQALFRVAIKHKSIFNKLSQKIKQSMSSSEINAVVQKDIQEKQKNEFQEPKQIEVRNLMSEEDIKKNITDHYGDISKVNEKTLKGLMYYLKIPKDKQGQENRYRQVLASKISYSVSNVEKLRQKLSVEYSLPSPIKKKKSQLNTSGVASSQKKEKTLVE